MNLPLPKPKVNDLKVLLHHPKVIGRDWVLTKLSCYQIPHTLAKSRPRAVSKLRVDSHQ